MSKSKSNSKKNQKKGIRITAGGAVVATIMALIGVAMLKSGGGTTSFKYAAACTGTSAEQAAAAASGQCSGTIPTTSTTSTTVSGGTGTGSGTGSSGSTGTSGNTCVATIKGLFGTNAPDDAKIQAACAMINNTNTGTSSGTGSGTGSSGSTGSNTGTNGGQVQASNGGPIDLLGDGRSTNARESTFMNTALSPDCKPYGDTGVGDPNDLTQNATKHWKCTINAGVVVISGGVTSHTVGTNSGFLVTTTGPTTWEDTIYNGFYSLVPVSNGEQEWCSRMNEARLPIHNWIYRTVTVLPGWNGCSAQLIAQAKADNQAGTGNGTASNSSASSTGAAAAAPCADPNTVNCMPRRQTNKGATSTFTKGEAVMGYTITVGGKDLSPHDCYLASASADGKVLDGAINPNKGEPDGKPACS